LLFLTTEQAQTLLLMIAPQNATRGDGTGPFPSAS
jgi:hypothetical protein